MLTLIEPGEQFARIGSTIWVVAHLWGMGILGVPESDIERKTGAEGQNLFNVHVLFQGCQVQKI